MELAGIDVGHVDFLIVADVAQAACPACEHLTSDPRGLLSKLENEDDPGDDERSDHSAYHDHRERALVKNIEASLRDRHFSLDGFESRQGRVLERIAAEEDGNHAEAERRREQVVRCVGVRRRLDLEEQKRNREESADYELHH
eukprot:1190904-Prymnesium_polylepis.1